MALFPVVDGVEVILAPPAGWVVNFTNPTRNPIVEREIKWAFGIEYPIATLFLIQRLYTSLFLVRKFLIDDYLMVLAWALLSASCAMTLHLCNNGYVGLHAWEQPLDQTIHMTGVLLAITLTAILGTLLAKLALCIFYYRLIIGRWYRYSIFFTGALTILCFGITFFVNMFACHPIAASWNLRLTTGSSCISRSPFYVLQAFSSGITDLLLMITPIPTVLGLQMSNRAKAAILLWFCIGIVTLVMSIMRLISLWSQLSSKDIPWTIPDAMLWLAIESNLIIVCCCLPTLRIFIRHILPKKIDRADSGGKPNNVKSLSLVTFGQSARLGRPRRHFNTIAEIDPADDLDLQDNACGYTCKVAIDTHIGEDSPRCHHGSQEAIVQTKGFVVSEEGI